MLAGVIVKTSRTYTMRSRADAVARTRERILATTFDLAQTTRFADIGLDAVAAGAQVSVQTVLRQFGNRAGLMDATLDHANEVIMRERETPVGDAQAAVRAVVQHYEDRGSASLLLLSQEAEPGVGALVARAKAMHRAWVRAVFAPQIEAGACADLLVVALDVYTWKLLRRDAGHSRARTQALMDELVGAVLSGGSS